MDIANRPFETKNKSACESRLKLVGGWFSLLFRQGLFYFPLDFLRYRLNREFPVFDGGVVEVGVA